MDAREPIYWGLGLFTDINSPDDKSAEWDVTNYSVPALAVEIPVAGIERLEAFQPL